ncbi:hypothetical protein GD416_17855 [Burkholderia sp. BE24]|uniref:hypothetical protein n=1 Tax=unclassified Burkholderia TaxID=2613784 RepID=UPI00117E9D51|nr:MULTISPECIES: hypothetical protein [unclassified Burkholderia]MPV58235.1 hypothetical protein [Burkholderia sp. BE24]
MKTKALNRSPHAATIGKRWVWGYDDGEAGEDHEGSGEADGTDSPVRCAPDRATPTRRSGQPTSYRQRGGSSSVIHYVCSQVHCIFFLAAPRHYPLNSAEVKRLRLHPSCYSGDSETFFPNAFGHCDMFRLMLHSVRRSF